MTLNELRARFGRGELDLDKIGAAAFFAALTGPVLVVVLGGGCGLAWDILKGGSFDPVAVLLSPTLLIGIAIAGLICSSVGFAASFPVILVLRQFGWLSGYSVVATGVIVVALPGFLSGDPSLIFPTCGGVTAGVFWWNARTSVQEGANA